MKKSKTIYAVSLITVAALAVFISVLVHAVAYDPSNTGTFSPQEVGLAPALPDGGTTAAVKAPPAAASVPNDPKTLIIPSIGVDAHVQYTGLTGSGAIGTPTNFTDVAWYEYGPIPGGDGSAVIDGHVDNGLSLAGVFKHLSSVQVGDDIYIVDNDGTKLHFVVTATNVYDYQNAPTADIFTTTGPAELKLITCDGTWVPSGRTYDERFVVTATLQNS